MAKQTFTTGQVLTAAQMTSLQETAMGGGSATAKTASYVLVAADAGTVVAMNAAGSTTITVNTGLFSAGDTVFIQNWGAGTCTVTAGTATVNTHGSLALSQYEGGTLYFTSASAAIFFDISQTSGMTNPMTTTGDTIYSSSGSTPARLGIGSTGQVLTVSGGVPTWATPSSGTPSFVGCVLSNTSETLSYSNNTVTTVALNYEAIDTDSFHDNSTNNTRITIPSGKAGKYRFTANMLWASATTGVRQINIKKNGSTVKSDVQIAPNTVSGGVTSMVNAILDLSVSDYIEFTVLQNSGSSLSGFFSSGLYGWFEAQYLGA